MPRIEQTTFWDIVPQPPEEVFYTNAATGEKMRLPQLDRVRANLSPLEFVGRPLDIQSKMADRKDIFFRPTELEATGDV